MNKELTFDYLEYLKLLSKSYPSIQSAATEIINLKSILNLPKSTEHFLSDIHGEYDSFIHMLNSGSGVIKDKIVESFPDYSDEEKDLLATIIYYPVEKLDYLRSIGKINKKFYHQTLSDLIDIVKITASKYTRSKVRKSMSNDFSYIIEELMQSHDFVLNKEDYYKEIVNTIIITGRADAFIIEICKLIQRLSVDHLHILGDIYDRGSDAYRIMERLTELHSIDITWGNHDIVYIGAGAGNSACVANVIRTSCRYNHLSTLEDGYGISLRPLVTFALNTYRDDPCVSFIPTHDETGDVDDNDLNVVAKMHKAITIIEFKLEGALIKNHPNYHAENLLKFDKIDYENNTIELHGKTYNLIDGNFPTIDPKNPFKLTAAEKELVKKLTLSFKHCDKFQKHMEFLLTHGSMYLKYNSNLLFHGCIPTDADGEFTVFTSDTGNKYSGKEFLDYCDKKVRRGFYSKTDDKSKKDAIDFYWYLWCGKYSPLHGKDSITTFERYFVDSKDKILHEEPKNAYYQFIDSEEYAKKILREFELNDLTSVIINGHMPVKIQKGESPIRANGKLFIIDGGISKAYQKVTGIAGYTLINNSFGMKLIAHQPFTSKEKAVREDEDVVHSVQILNPNAKGKTVAETDRGMNIKREMDDLMDLLECYHEGTIKNY